MLYDIIFTARSHQHQTHSSSLTRVPLIIIVILLLLGQHLRQDRHQVLQRAFGIETAGTFRWATLLLRLQHTQ